MEDLDYAALNPGIRRTVHLLREAGFNTTDSSDGATHEYECDRGYPYVSIITEHPTETADALLEVLATEGVSVLPIGTDGDRGIYIQATYDPANRIGVVELVNMTDADLAPGYRPARLTVG